jgi:hypothetical protein
MVGLFLNMDVSRVVSIQNNSHDLYRVEFKEEDKLIYSVVIGASLSVSIPYEVYDRWSPFVKFTKL